MSSPRQGTQTQNKSIVVFAPTPILTVTVEADFDDKPELHLHAGGQGFWVARMVARLQVPVILCGPFGGDTGRVLRDLVEREGVELRSTDVSGTNGSYVHDRREGQRKEIVRIGGERLTRHEMDDFYNSALSTALDSEFAILTGQFPTPIVPPELYRRLAHDLSTNGCRVMADLSGEDLKQALEGGVHVLSLSHEQLIEDGYSEDDSLPTLVRGIQNLRTAGAQNVILHRAENPTLVVAEDRLLEVRAPQVQPLDHRGGGDTFFATLAVGLWHERSLEDTLRLAAAAGTLNVTRHGLGTGCMEDIEALSHRVQVRDITEEFQNE